jgi:hypothetical protein
MTGVLTLAAALSYGELAAMMPRAGGQYVYLREAFGPLWGFLYGWTLFMVIQTGTIAAVAVGFARYTGYLIPWFAEDHYIVAPIHVSTGYAFSLSTVQLLGIVHDRAADVDQHARTRLGQDHSERLHDDEDRRAARAHCRRAAVRLELAGRRRRTSAISGRRAARRRSRPASTPRRLRHLHRAVRRAGRIALLSRCVEQHHVHRGRGQRAARAISRLRSRSAPPSSSRCICWPTSRIW